MRNLFLPLWLFFSAGVAAQTDTIKHLRAFPITDYILRLDDSTDLVQLRMPEEHPVSMHQLGLMRGTYRDAHTDTVEKGYGRCYLVKGEYYYFAIRRKKGGVELKEGDLLYTFMPGKNIYDGRIPRLAAHFIQLQDVYEERFYDRYTVFLGWTRQEEEHLLDFMVRDIQMTGAYFLEQDPSMNIMIEKGAFKGKKVLDLMKDCHPAWVTDFMDYVIVRPRLYAGRQWKISEVFATWLTEGAPTVARP